MNSQNQNESPRKSEELNQSASSSNTNTSNDQRSSTPNSTPETPARSEELQSSDLKETNGGSILGNDNSSITGIITGAVNLSHTDENGDTESTNLDFGTGSLLNTSND